ncbi:MAG: hypothetical protein IIZ93_13800 [Acidaminococcaceae bacterium]|nr:hypothetical protein [Acidaminococcaceae bacterium]
MADGIHTSVELVDSLIIDLNNLPKDLIDGQFIQFCTKISQMGQKLINLRTGIKSDTENKNQIIEELKRQLRNAGSDIEDMTPEEFSNECVKGKVLNNGSN